MRDKSTNRVFVVAASIFFALGMIAAIGPALPEIARNNGSSLAATGAVFTALFLGAVPAQLLTGWLNEKFGTWRVLAGGLLVMGLGMFGATMSRDLLLTLAFMVFAGLGDGVLVVGANVLVAQTFTKRSASALNFLNVFYGVGAIVAPALVGLSIGALGTALPPIWLLSVLLILIVLGIPGLNARGGTNTADRERNTFAPESRPVYLSPVACLLGLLLLIYVGVEVGTGGWIAVYMQRTTNLSVETAAFMGSAFYMALTAGRLIAAGLGMKLHPGQLFMGSLVAASIAGVGLLLGVGNLAVTVASLALLGMAFGPIYPTMLSVVAALFPTSASKAAGFVMSVGGVGGLVIPWLQGVMIEDLGAWSFALSAAIGTLGMLALYSVVTLLARRRTPRASTAGAPYPTYPE
ncbi:MAG: MFS transporter [Chloroflexia bacterium]